MQVLGYDVSTDKELIDAPCACNECRNGQADKLDRPYGQGHFQCEVVPAVLLEAEEQDKIDAQYTDNAWRWFTV